MPVISAGATPIVATQALWSWNTSGVVPQVIGYPSALASGTSSGFTPTKTGLVMADVQSYVGVPLVYYGNPSVPMTTAQVMQFIRYAEDYIEQETSILLCQTWVASPPGMPPETCEAIGISVNDPSKGQQQGIDYDLEDAAYDFKFDRAQDEGWMYQTLRYRPVKSLQYTARDFTAVKRIAYIYPLLNEFFTVPASWIVEDRDYGLVRLVPAANVQMLPLFAMQLAFMGFAQSVPGALWFQYTAGLTPNDYQSRFSFMRELVLAETAVRVLTSIQGTINLGAEQIQATVDGLQYRTAYPKSGPFGPLIEQFQKRRDTLMFTAKSKVNGLIIGSI